MKLFRIAALTILTLYSHSTQAETIATPNPYFKKIKECLSRDGDGRISKTTANVIKMLFYAAQEKGNFDHQTAVESLNSLLHHCVEKDTYTDRLELLLELNANPNASIIDPIWYTYDETMDEFIPHTIIPLESAVEHDKPQFITPLINAGADVHAIDIYLLSWIYSGKIKEVTLLIKHGVTFEESAFKTAFLREQYTLLTSLLEYNEPQFKKLLLSQSKELLKKASPEGKEFLITHAKNYDIDYSESNQPIIIPESLIRQHSSTPIEISSIDKKTERPSDKASQDLAAYEEQQLSQIPPTQESTDSTKQPESWSAWTLRMATLGYYNSKK